ncbi:MAG TPA: hypothetical protein VN784_13100 [Candidatus Limnocylindrales bacterium]|nr:hypothetical protein [Candidatus Limnocylindrales bacterium]
MKTIKFRFAIILAIGILFFATTGSKCQPVSGAVMPIKIEDAPITSAIANLARFAGLNYILDPKLCDSFLNSDGKVTQEPIVTLGWTNLTASQAISQLLKEHGFVMVTNAATPVVLITYTNRIVIPLDADLLGNDTNGVVPPINLRNTPLDEAFKQLAKAAHFEIVIDFKIPAGVNMPQVSLRWEKVTARQAIVALCEAYNLVIAKDSSTGAVVIKLAEKPQPSR